MGTRYEIVYTTDEGKHKGYLPDTPWNPPDFLLDDVNWGEFKDLNGREFPKTSRSDIYKFPWYLSWLHYWYGIKHWWKTKEWPVKILYFTNGEQRDMRIFLEVIERPQIYYSVDNTTWALEEKEEDFDKLFEEVS